jgi:hypothetical protein
MRRHLVCGGALERVLADAGHALGQMAAGLFESFDLSLLARHHLIQHAQGFFLIGDFCFQLDQALFIHHRQSGSSIESIIP